MIQARRGLIEMYNFVGRNEEIDLFVERLKYLTDARETEHKKSYILAFNGVGGIGKSYLKNHFIRMIRGMAGQSLPNNMKCDYIMVNCSKASGMDGTCLPVLVSMRRQLLEIKGADYLFPRFDSALNYIDSVYKQSLSSDKLNNQNDTSSVSYLLGNSTALIDFLEIGKNAAEINGYSVGLGSLLSIIMKFFAAFRKKGKIRKHFSKAEREEQKKQLEILDDDHMVDFLFEAFVADLNECMEKKHHNKPLVIFVDTYENFANSIYNEFLGKRNKEPGWLRADRNALMKSIGNTLWVVFGRDMLDWDSFSEHGKVLGEEKKSAITLVEEVHKMSLPKYTEEETREYLLGEDISETSLLSGLYKLTEGHPFYLRIAAKLYHEAAGNHELSIADFGDEPEDLIERLIDTIKEEYQESIIILGILGEWTEKTIEEMINCSQDVSAFMNFHQSYAEIIEKHNSFICEDGYGYYRMDSVVRKVILARADKGLIDSVHLVQQRVLDAESELQHNYLKYCEQQFVFWCDETVSIERIYEDVDRIIEALNGLESRFLFKAQLYCALKIYNKLLVDEERENKCAFNRLTGCLSDALANNGEFEKALQLVEKVYVRLVSILGNEDPHTLTAMSRLAARYLDTNQLKKALKCGNDLCQICRRVFGEEALETLEAMHNLAYYCAANELYKEALNFEKMVYEKREQILGKMHPDTLRSLSRLASYCRKMGRATEALSHGETAFALQKKVLGNRHPDTVQTMIHLALFLLMNHRNEEALAYGQKAYELSKEVFGDYNAKTLQALYNLAGICIDNRKNEEALMYGEMAYDGQKKVFGEDDRRTLDTLDYLATVYIENMQYEKAVESAKKVYEIEKGILGENHETVLKDLGRLAKVCISCKKIKEAIEYSLQAYEIARRDRGELDSLTLDCLLELSENYSDVGAYEEALNAAKEEYNGRTKSEDVNEIAILDSTYNLAECYINLERHEEAIEYAEKAYLGRLAKYGERHPETLEAFFAMTYCYAKLGRSKIAEEYAWKLYEIENEVWGPNHLKTLAAYNLLVQTLCMADKLGEALEHGLKAHDNALQVADEEDEIVLSIENSLAVVYYQIGLWDNAIHFFDGVIKKGTRRYGECSASVRQAKLGLEIALKTKEGQ